MSLTAAPEGHSFQLKWPRFPFPGLRPFRETTECDESLIFYGRNKQKDDILRRLDSAQFVSVVGPSGCGKSSLVKVGVIHALTAGLLTKAGWNWRIAEMRPGSEPLANLAAALATLGGSFDPDFGTAEAQIRQVLASERSALWLLMDHLAPALRQDANAPRASRVLLLIDQFEEIFSGGQDQRAVDQFIGLVSEFFHKPHAQLYIVLTMRTDFIGQCANFPGLAEILNDTQYITPVLRGADLRDAITSPAQTYQGEIEPELVTELVRDMGSGAGYDADHLPLMQHALLWLWQRACADAGITEPSGPDPDWPAHRPRVRLTLDEYRRHGRLAGILNRHADDILARIESGPDGKAAGRIVELMFRRMTERDASARYKRSPVLASEVCALARCMPHELGAAIEPFCGIGASFVERRPTDRPDDPLLDLSHESLIRQWRWLREKADDEAGKLFMFRRFTNDAQGWDQHARSRAYLKRGGQLWLLRDWWTKHQPTEAWARRYAIAEGSPDALSGCFPVVEAYRVASLRAERRARLVRWTAPPLGALALAGVIVLFFMLQNAERVRAQGEAITRAALLMGRDELEHHHDARALGIAVTLLHDKTAFPQVPAAERLAYEALEELRQHSVRELALPVGPRWMMDFSPGAREAVTGGNDSIAVTDTGTGKSLGAVRLPHSESPWAVRLSPDGSHVLLWAEDRAFVAPLDLHALPTEITDDHALLADGARIGFGFFSADGSRIATFAWGDPRTVYLWDAATGKRVERVSLATPAAFGFAPALNAGGTLLAVPTTSGVVTVYDLTKGTRQDLSPNARDSLNNGLPRRPPLVAFHPARPATLVSVSEPRAGSGNGSLVVLWDLASDKPAWKAPDAVDAGEIAQVGFSPDGDFIAEWGSFGGRILSTGSGETTAVLGEHESGVSVLRFDPDSQHVATVGRDRDLTLRTWSLEADLPVGNARADLVPRDAKSSGSSELLQPQHGAGDTRDTYVSPSGALRVVAAPAKSGDTARRRRHPVKDATEAGSDEEELWVYRKGDADEPVAALHGLKRGTDVTALRLNGGDTLVASTSDGYQHSWHYFPDRKALLTFAENELSLFQNGQVDYVRLTAIEQCLLESEGGQCLPGGPEKP